MLNTQIGKVDRGTTFGYSYCYWSSTEDSDRSDNAWYVDFYDGYVYCNGYKYVNPYRVRPLLAF